MEEIYLDPRAIYGEESESWEVLWDNEQSLYANIYGILSQCVVLPNNNVLMPIAVTYTLIPSKWAKVLPVLFSYGEKGTGKSTFAIFASKLHGQKQLFSAADTFASLRNSLDGMRWIDPESKEYEKDGAILCWDNIHAETLRRDNRIFQMLLFGYNRNSERINIANNDGTNREYYVFSPKIISSIEPLHTIPDFEELHRRLLVIKHKQFEKFTLSEKEGLPDDWSITSDRLDLDAFSWEGIEDEFYKFWNNPDNCKMYAKYRSLLTRRGKKPFTVPSSIKGEQWTISIDLICTGLLVGTWENLQQAIDAMAAYWSWFNSTVEDSSSAMLKHLSDFITLETAGITATNELLLQAGNKPIRVSIASKKIKSHLDFLLSEGALDIMPSNANVSKVMCQLGWRLDRDGWVQIV